MMHECNRPVWKIQDNRGLTLVLSGTFNMDIGDVEYNHLNDLDYEIEIDHANDDRWERKLFEPYIDIIEDDSEQSDVELMENQPLKMILPPPTPEFNMRYIFIMIFLLNDNYLFSVLLKVIMTLRKTRIMKAGVGFVGQYFFGEKEGKFFCLTPCNLKGRKITTFRLEGVSKQCLRQHALKFHQICLKMHQAVSYMASPISCPVCQVILI